MSILKKIISLFTIYVLFIGSIYAKQINYKHEYLYRNAQRDLAKRRYKPALENFLEYIKLTKKEPYKKERLFWAIDHVARIYLRIQENPKQAIKFFESFENDDRLNDIYFDIIEEWKIVAKEWEKTQKSKLKLKNPDKIFAEGLRQYRLGLPKGDEKGAANLSIAMSYFSKLIFNHPEHKSVPRALLLMGDIKSKLRTDSDYWGENFYLKEVIIRAPHTNLSLKAWEKLNDDTRQGYSGSGGDSTPPEIINMLSRYKKMATPQVTKTKKK